MYSKEQASQLKQAFWTAFGQYMSPILSADGEKIGWVNYKTGIKHVYFRMYAGSNLAGIAIEIAYPDAGVRELFFEQFKELKNILSNCLNEEWEWQLHTTDEYGKTVSRIVKELSGVNVFDNNNWPMLISFLKSRIIALDEFWSSARYSFDALR